MAGEPSVDDATDWPLLELGSLAHFINGDRSSNYPSITDFTPDGLPFISASDIHSSGLALASVKRITTAAFDRLSSGKVQQGDLLFCLRGSLGKVARITTAMTGAIASSLVIIRPRSQVDGKYLFYVLSGPVGQAITSRLDNGSVQPNISAAVLKKQRFWFPLLDVQKRIAHILGTLDDKIDLNRRMNATLEGISRAIFKSWFVDFDPVRQKAAGKQPVGMDAQTAALFPDSFQESEIGEVPKGWDITEVRDLLSLKRESVDPAEHPAETFDHYSIPAFDAGCWPSPDAGNAIKSQKLVVPPGCVLISKLNPRTPRVWIPQAISERRGIASTEFLVAIPAETRGVGVAFLFCFALADSFVDYLASHASGTSNSHQRVRPDDLLSYQVALPQSDVLFAFDRIAEPLLRKSSHSRSESKRLAALRDTLLPKLLSGEIRVPEAGQAVEEATQ
jgi:type I restriction enzyme S subunit